jgi:hypothetical protein
MEAVSTELQELAERALHEGAPSHARRAFYQLSYVHWEGGAWSEARRDVMQVEALGRGSGHSEQVASIAHAARCLILLERDMGEAGAMLMEAEARARPLGLEPPSMVDARGMLRLHQAEYDEALSLFERAHALAAASGDRLLEYQTIEHQVMVELDRERYARACELAGRLLELGERLRQGSEEPFARAVLSIARYGSSQGTDEGCQAQVDAALESLRLVDAKHRLAYALLHAALLDLRHGQPGRAAARAGEARPIAELLERPTETLLSLSLLSRAASDLGDTELRSRVADAIAAGSWQGASSAARARRELLLGQG